VAAHPEQWYQDEDVLDTWFSASLWPLSILGWPEKTEELKRFYPNDVLVTGHDILFFWVARMLLVGEYLEGTAPFPETFLHGLIYGKSYWRERQGGGISYLAEQEREAYDLGKPIPHGVFFKWEKMSKTKGNIINPIEIIEHYGADAMRMALCSSATQAREIDLDRRRFEEFKNFANKLWNGARFTLLYLDGQGSTPLDATLFAEGIDEEQHDLEDLWLLSRLGQTVREVNMQLANYAFDQAATAAYDFFWREFCAYYLEIAKPVLTGKRGTPNKRVHKRRLLAIALCQAVRLIHPMAPFISEELFQQLKQRLCGTKREKQPVDPYTQETLEALASPACVVAPYPQLLRTSDIQPDIEKRFAQITEVIYSIRNIRGEMKLPPSEAVEVYIACSGTDPNKESLFQQLARHRYIIEALVRVQSIELCEENLLPTLGTLGNVAGLKILIPLPGHFRAQEQRRLEKEKQRLEATLLTLRERLGNEAFLAKAPAPLVEEQKQKIADTEQQWRDLHAMLDQLSKQ